jgi:hypothetical protein
MVPDNGFMKFTSFAVAPSVNAKNTSCSFAKHDQQTHFARNRADDSWINEREKKRRRLMASEEELDALEQDLGNGGKGFIDVLASTSTGPVHRPGVAIAAEQVIQSRLGLKDPQRSINTNTYHVDRLPKIPQSL